MKRTCILLSFISLFLVSYSQNRHEVSLSVNASDKNINVGDGYYFKGYNNLKIKISFNVIKTDNKLCILDYSCSSIILATGPMVFEDPQGKSILVNNTQKISNINFIIDFLPIKSASGLHSVSFQNVALQTSMQSTVNDKHISLQQNACNNTINTTDVFNNVKTSSFSFSNLDLEALKKIISPYKTQKKSEDDFWNSDKPISKETPNKQQSSSNSGSNSSGGTETKSNSTYVNSDKTNNQSFSQDYWNKSNAEIEKKRNEHKQQQEAAFVNSDKTNNQSFSQDYWNKSNAEIEKKRNEHKQQQEAALKKIISTDYQKQSETNYQNMTLYVNQMTDAMIAYDKEKRRKEEEREKIEYEKKQAEQRKLETENKLIANFNSYVNSIKAGHTPKPSQVIEQDFVYIFFYYPLANGPYDLNIYLSNIVKVYKQSDGTWPYEIDIKNKVNSFNNKTNSIQGYYLNYNDAVMVQNNIVANAKNYYALVKTYDVSALFKEKATDNSNKNNVNKAVPDDKKDFWND